MLLIKYMQLLCELEMNNHKFELCFNKKKKSWQFPCLSPHSRWIWGDVCMNLIRATRFKVRCFRYVLSSSCSQSQYDETSAWQQPCFIPPALKKKVCVTVWHSLNAYHLTVTLLAVSVRRCVQEISRCYAHALMKHHSVSWPVCTDQLHGPRDITAACDAGRGEKLHSVWKLHRDEMFVWGVSH